MEPKRRRVKQTLTPSPIHKKDDSKNEIPEHPNAPEKPHDEDSDHGDSEITVEEIMKMYESR